MLEHNLEFHSFSIFWKKLQNNQLYKAQKNNFPAFINLSKPTVCKSCWNHPRWMGISGQLDTGPNDLGWMGVNVADYILDKMTQGEWETS